MLFTGSANAHCHVNTEVNERILYCIKLYIFSLLRRCIHCSHTPVAGLAMFVEYNILPLNMHVKFGTGSERISIPQIAPYMVVIMMEV